MSATVLPRRKGRPPKLKVVGGEPRTRHRCTWSSVHEYRVVEFWTESEWDALTKWERQEFVWAQWLPGVGRVLIRAVTQDEAQEAREENQHQVDFWRAHLRYPPPDAT